jgi:hypothetical protein
MGGVEGIESLPAGRAQAWTGGIAQGPQGQVGQDILPQNLIQVDFVVLVDQEQVGPIGDVERQTGANVGAGQELFVEFALDLDSRVFEAAGAFQDDFSAVLAVDEDAVRRAREARMA